MRIWIRSLAIGVFIFPLVVLVVWYLLSFVVNISELNKFAKKGGEVVDISNPILYELVVAAESKSTIRGFAMKNAYYSIVYEKEKSRIIWWHLNNLLWYYASYLHFSDKDVFAIWVECSLSPCGKGLNDASEKYFGKKLNLLSVTELAQLVASVRSPSKYALGSAQGNERASLLLKSIETHNNALNTQPPAAGSPKSGGH